MSFHLGRLSIQILGVVLAASSSACGHVQLRSPIAPAAGPPSSFVRSTSDARSTRVVDVRDGVTKATAFRAATDLLDQRYSVDVSDSRAGFLMTPWETPLVRGGVPDLRYRVRVVIRFLGDDWKQASVRAEANWRRDDEWDVGYDSAMLDSVAADLRARVCRKP